MRTDCHINRRYGGRGDGLAGDEVRAADARGCESTGKIPGEFGGGLVRAPRNSELDAQVVEVDGLDAGCADGARKRDCLSVAATVGEGDGTRARVASDAVGGAGLGTGQVDRRQGRGMTGVEELAGSDGAAALTDAQGTRQEVLAVEGGGAGDAVDLSPQGRDLGRNRLGVRRAQRAVGSLD